jgi:S-adenosylmethionine synthetase
MAYAIGMAQPVSIFVETFGTNHMPHEEIEAAVRATFDLRPGAIVRDLELKRPIYRQTAAYGHFGRPDLPWEELSRLTEFKAALGV